MANRIKGKNLTLTVDGEEFNLDGTSVVLDSEDADQDDVTFAEYSEGGGAPKQQWFFTLSALANYDASSFWSMLWDAHTAGAEIAYVFKPYGNASPTTTQPHFTGEVTVPKKPPVGGNAGETWTYEQRLDCVDEPVLDRTA